MSASRRRRLSSRAMFALALALALHGHAPVAAAGPVVLHYPRPESQDDERGEYGYELLRLALWKAGGDYVVERSPVRMPQSRAIVELMAPNGRVDILSTMTSRQREQQLLPIRIPLSRGLVGWRIALLNGARRDLLRRARAVADLKALSAGQGHDWPDIDILRHSGLTVHPVVVYDALFGMLKADRIDWLPRSVNEIWAEAGRHPELAVDPHVVLRYPAADYFFVNRDNTALAAAVLRGLEAALADGSFEQLFYAHFAEGIRRARLDQRRVIDLPNPLLSPETPLARRELWFSLDDLKRLP